MTSTEALTLLNRLPCQQVFNDLQALIFCQAWEGKSYEDIADLTGYDANYIRDVGAKIWRMLSATLQQRIIKRNFQSILQHYSQHDLATPDIQESTSHDFVQSDWGNAIVPDSFYGRTQELALLQEWVAQDCRLIALLGMGGMGKTTLALKFAQNISGQFEKVIWRSLHSAPTLNSLLLDLLAFLSEDCPVASEQDLMSQVFEQLQRSRCLLILDNAETVLADPAYRVFLQRIGEIRHQSCVILTSREMPKELDWMEQRIVRSHFLQGLSVPEGQKIFQHKGNFSASEAEWRTLIQYYAGNPLALKIAAGGIAEAFNYDVAAFLSFMQQNHFMFDDLTDLLQQQFDNLTELEQEVMFTLASQQSIRLLELQKHISSNYAKRLLPVALKSLRRRSLVEFYSGEFSLQSDVMDYVKARNAFPV